ncbi:MAG: helix-turn-helix transcriptional regulator [Deltaproteobacteria bacterium]|nr:helix-turn-helix transcriptional regulator [Candidatus Tharpella aukensis]
MKNDEFISAKRHALITTGETIRMLRELKGWTQEDLAKRSGINSKNISLLENSKVDIGKKRAEQIANAFGVHPAIIMFPEYEADLMQKVA